MNSKWIKVFLFLMIFKLPTFAQRDSQLNIVKDYYNLINKAELAILDSNFSLASNYYVEAFKMKFPSGKDISNAFLLSLNIIDSIKAKEYLDIMALKGYYLSEGELDEYPSSKYITSSYDSLFDINSIYKDSVTNRQGLIDRAFFDSLKVRDQSVRNGGEVNDKTNRIDTENIDLIIDYVNQYGFPSFERVGFWTLFDWTSGSEGALQLVLWHNSQMFFTREKIAKIIEIAIANGDFNPDNWEFIKAVGNYQTKLANADPAHFLVKNGEILSDSEIQTINVYRENHLLCNYADYRRKLDYEVANHMKRLEAFKNQEQLPTTYHFLSPFIPSYLIESSNNLK